MSPSIALMVMRCFGEIPKEKKEDYHLTPKESEVLKKLAEGLSYKMIADQLGISYFIVNNHVKKIYEKLHMHSLGEARWLWRIRRGCCESISVKVQMKL